MRRFAGVVAVLLVVVGSSFAKGTSRYVSGGMQCVVARGEGYAA
jgi:hypothetical protein